MTDPNSIKIEFAVQISGKKCTDEVGSALQDVGLVEINEEKGSVLVHTALPWTEVQRKIEATGRRAVLSGFGGQSAVSIVNHGNEASNVTGVVRFCALATGQKGAVIDGIIDGLEANKLYDFNVHECGDISDGCSSVGAVYLSNKITSDENGRATIRFIDNQMLVSDIIGRSAVVAQEQSEMRLACGIIARSAGIFENYKKICACDGVTIWDERSKPLAGAKRSGNKTSKV